MQSNADFTKGRILGPLLKFMLPVLLALFLQAMYGAVDLMIVGRFGTAVDVSAVSTGSQIMMTLTDLLVSLSMGTTIFLGQLLGEGRKEESGDVVGTSICLFFVMGAVLTVLIPLGAPALARIMHAPEEAFALTTAYIRICGGGAIVIIAYNLIGSIFRGIGDSRTPLLTVLIACVCNIFGDLLLVAGFGMGTAGAAIATVAAQLVSVAVSLAVICRRQLPFAFSRRNLHFVPQKCRKVLSLGLPIALQDFLVGISFLIILAIVNELGLTASAGVGVAEKVCAFIMLIPSAFMQAMAAFVAQNYGAGRYDRARKALLYAIGVSAVCAVAMFYLAVFHGDMLSGIFASDPEVIAAGTSYLRAYGIDCLLTCFLFCFIGFFNGIGYTRFVMVQGMIGAFCVRVPVSFVMSRWQPVSLFHIGLATPASSLVQINMCFVCFWYANKKLGTGKKAENADALPAESRN